MRIISKVHDFYDYLQNPTDKIVFDRRGAAVVKKEDLARFINTCDRGAVVCMIVRCGTLNLLFRIYSDGIGRHDFINSAALPKYSLELLDSWKQYDVANVDTATGACIFELKRYYKADSSTEKIKAAVKNGDYYRYPLGGYKNQNMIFADLGFAALVNPFEVFSAIEEYFSLKRQATERTEPLGVTNDDKIVMHGFDTKTSFRGK